jgi:hypothetical protein
MRAAPPRGGHRCMFDVSVPLPVDRGQSAAQPPGVVLHDLRGTTLGRGATGLAESRLSGASAGRVHRAPRAFVPQQLTPGASVNPLPVTVTMSPPATDPLGGLTPVTVGAVAAAT